MKLVIGLGNPGPEYRHTRHNIGFLAIDEYLRRAGAAAKKSSDDANYSKIESCWFIKPQTFMNRSGGPVVRWVERVSAEPGEVIVLHDEADLEEGRLQLRCGGGTGGHKGLESILGVWGERDFYRLRIGIGKPEGGELADYVLADIGAVQLKPLQEAAADALEEIFRSGPNLAMNKVNARA